MCGTGTSREIGASREALVPLPRFTIARRDSQSVIMVSRTNRTILTMPNDTPSVQTASGRGCRAFETLRVSTTSTSSSTIFEVRGSAFARGLLSDEIGKSLKQFCT